MTATQNSTATPAAPPDPAEWWRAFHQKCRDAAMAFGYDGNEHTAEVFLDAAKEAERVLDELEVLEGLKKGEG